MHLGTPFRIPNRNGVHIPVDPVLDFEVVEKLMEKTSDFYCMPWIDTNSAQHKKL